jgi:hypothetical protein
MRLKKEVKEDLLAALESEGDRPLSDVGFKRRKRSIYYTRKKANVSHIIVFFADFSPRYQPDAEAHLLPQMRLKMPLVSERALALVNGNEMLLGEPDLIFGQPIEFAAPKNYHVRWFATGLNEFQDRIREIVAFAQIWAIPFFDELTGLESLVNAYLQEDNRLFKQLHEYLYVVAALDLLGMRKKACEILETKFGSLGLRKRYSAAFENLGLSSTAAK